MWYMFLSSFMSILCSNSASNKQIQRIYVPRHYDLQIMTKTSVKFQKNRHKTVGGVAHTRYPVSINFDSKNARKMPKLK